MPSSVRSSCCVTLSALFNFMRSSFATFLVVVAIVTFRSDLLPVAIPSVLAEPTVFWQSVAKTNGDGQVLSAYKHKLSNVIVEDVSGTVEKLLADDLEGSRHQRFIIRMTDGHTLLIVHNIDLALRLNSLRVGDRVSVKGEYEWNEQGGLIHWTHRDPNSQHEDGWIIHENVRYE